MSRRVVCSLALVLCSLGLAVAPLSIARLSDAPLAAADKSVHKKDVEFALKEVEGACKHLIKSKDISWKKVKAEFKKTAKTLKTDQDEFAALVRILARLRDGHASVRPSPGLQIKWPGVSLEKGLGLFWCVDGDRVFVKNSWGAAANQGVVAGSEILKVDGEPAHEWLAARVAEIADTSSFSTAQQGRFFACHWGLGGAAGDTVKLQYKRPDGKTKKRTLRCTERTGVPSGPVFAPSGLARTGRQSYGKTAKGYGYIHLRDVPGELPGQLDEMLASLGNVPGLILDCRANGGGGCDHDAVFGRFVPAGKTISFGKKYASAGATPYAGPMVVIIDAGVRSAGETVSGMFKEDGRAYMIGESATAGMSSSKTEIKLPSGNFTLRVSVRSNKGRFNGGKGIEGIGVPPHEMVPYDPSELAEGVDTLIRRAEELLADFPEKKVPYRPERFGWEPPETTGK